MPAFNNYDPGRYFLIVKGVQIQGPADGTFIKARRKNPVFASKAGANGDVVRTRSRDRRGEFEVTLLAASISNDYLSSLLEADENDLLLGGPSPSVGPVMLKDANGTTVLSGANGWVVGYADVEAAVEHPNRVWMIEVDVLLAHVGGLVV